MAKATEAQVNQRILTVYDYLLQGKTRQRIIQLCSKFGVSERQIDTYIKRASELIKQELIQDKSIIKSTVLQKQLDLYDLAVGKEDYETARKILSDFTKLNDLENPDKLQIESTNTNINKEVRAESTENLLQLVKKRKQSK